MLYCNITWGQSTQTLLNKIFKLQKRATRTILNKPYKAHTAPLFKELSILNIYSINIYSKCLFMFDYVHGCLPKVFDGMFRYNHNVHNHSTRHNDYFHLPFCRTEMSKNSIVYSGPYVFNKTMKNMSANNIYLTSKHIFKKSLLQHLLNEQSH